MTMQATELPSRVAAAAAERDLGAPTASARGVGVAMRVGIAGAAFVGAILLIFVFNAIGLQVTQTRAILALVILGAPCYVAYTLLVGTLSFYLFERGLVRVKGRSVTAVAWPEVRELTITRPGGGDAVTEGNPEYVLRLDGGTLELAGEGAQPDFGNLVADRVRAAGRPVSVGSRADPS